jgi:hypothetical protein
MYAGKESEKDHQQSKDPAGNRKDLFYDMTFDP